MRLLITLSKAKIWFHGIEPILENRGTVPECGCFNIFYKNRQTKKTKQNKSTKNKQIKSPNPLLNVMLINGLDFRAKEATTILLIGNCIALQTCVGTRQLDLVRQLGS